MNWAGFNWLAWQRSAAERNSGSTPLGHFLRAGLPSRGRDWREVAFIAIDLETTGLNPLAHEIASLGWVAIERGAVQLRSARQLLVKTQQGVGTSATLHYLTDAMTDRGQPLERALGQLLLAAEGKIPVFHNAGLDLGFLNNACLRCYDSQLVTPFVDTLELEKAKLTATGATLIPGCLRLHACRRRYHLPDSPAHNALDDALATAELFIAWASHQGGDGPLAWDEAV